MAYPAAPTDSPTLAFPSVQSYLPAESVLTPDIVHGADAEDMSDLTGTGGHAFGLAPATDTQGAAQVPEQPDDLQPQQHPREIHIQQNLKLHFQPQGEF